MPVELTPPAADIGKYYLLKVPADADHSETYFVCQSIVAFTGESVGGAVMSEVDTELRGSPAQACEIPKPGTGGVAWMKLQAKIQVQPPRP